MAIFGPQTQLPPKLSQPPEPAPRRMQAELPLGTELIRRKLGTAQPRAQSDEPVWELRGNVLDSEPGAPLAGEPVAGIPGAIFIPGLLLDSECQALVRLLEHAGFADGCTLVGTLEKQRRNDVCVLVVPRETGAELGRRLGALLPRFGAGGNGRCEKDFINVCFRCYRYKCDSDSADVFGPHFDSKQSPVTWQDGALMEDGGCGARESQMSALLYLSDGHSGGDTVFYPRGIDADPGLAEPVRVAPLLGACLCFWHGDHLLSPLHAGTALSLAADGRAVAPKYVIRTDVFFDLDD